MLDPPNPDPGLVRLATPRAVARKLHVEGINLGLALAVLSDGRVVPIVAGFDEFGDDCDLGSGDLHAFTCGSDDTGWWTSLVSGWDLRLWVQ
jgi:hypothetical protein